MNKKYVVRLTEEERRQLDNLIAKWFVSQVIEAK